MNQNKNEIELALRDGMIDELIEVNKKSTDIIARLSSIVESQNKEIERWERLNDRSMETIKRVLEQRNGAQALAIRLEAECHGCMDTVHHGNEEQY